MTIFDDIKNLKNLSPNAKIYTPGTPGYIQSTTSYYWTSSEQNPELVFQPAIPSDIATVLKLISQTDQDIPFAIKGGAHIAGPGFNSTRGLLFDMKLFDQIKYNEQTTLVDLGPGVIWDTVYEVLAPTGRNVAGASTCKGVGVAGFNLGGGYSNKTNQFGLALDSIHSIDVVLPTGTITKASASQNPELFWCLKGGGNNFGFVTNWTMVTHAQEPIIYSHTLVYQPEYFDALIPAILEFAKREVPKANIEAIFEYTLEKGAPVTIGNIECFYDGPTPPEGLFDGFYAIPHTEQPPTETWVDRQRNLPGTRQTYRVGRPNGVDDLPPFRGRFSSVMVSHYTGALINEALNLARGFSQAFVAHNGLQIYPDIWPFMPIMFDNSTRAAWPHVKGKPNGPLVINFKWEGEENDSFWLDAIARTTDVLRAVALAEGCTTEETPYYLNLSLEQTPTIDIYRDNLTTLQKLRELIDPKKFMNHTGGFRI